MKARATSNASVQLTQYGWKLGLQKGNTLSYQGAQLDDYSHLPRHKFPHQTLRLNLNARASSRSVLGTWGFGLWNDPFGLSLGFGGNPLRLPALPNAAWFFSASAQNYLSFTNNKPARGFLAQTFRSPKFHHLLFLAGLALPFSPRKTRKFLSKVIDEDGVALSLDVTQWHAYRLEWNLLGVSFYVDDVLVFETSVSPKPPLGIIIWIDNQFAAFTPEGKIELGVLETQECWLEVENVVIQKI